MLSRSIITNAVAATCLLIASYGYSQDPVQETSLADHIGSHYLYATFGEEKPTAIPAIDEDLNFIEKFKQDITKPCDPQKQILTPRKTQEIAFGLTKQLSFETTIVDSACIDKLEIIGDGKNNQQYLLEKIFHSVTTKIGKAQAALTFCHPTTDIALLKNRQQAIYHLSKNEQLINKCTTSLSIIADNEDKSLQIWDTVPPVNATLLKKFYLPSLMKVLNTKTLPLEIYNKGLCSLQIAWSTIGAPALKILVNCIVYQVKPIEGVKIIIERLVSPQIPLDTKLLENIDLLVQPIYIYQAVTSLQSTRDVANHLQKILIASTKHINELKKLSSLINKNPQLLKRLPSLQPLADLRDTTKHSAEFNKLLGMLNTNTFIGEPSFWSITGRILAAYELMKQTKDELAPVFVAAGELDMYVSLAKLYSSHQEKDAQYCMVNFVENSATPVIDARNFWNPFINADAVILNDITFDATCPNSILTGPNTGGKSTVIKGIMINILMAQTFGIAPSQKLAITPFTKLNCFMNISDDIATGASLFKSEVARAKKLLDMVQNLQDDEFSFVIIDEVFTGTSPQEGEIAALRFAQKLGSYSNNVGIIATHYPKMTNLEENTNGRFFNHHVEILRNEDGSLNRTFKLKNGPSFFNVAFDILEEEGLFV